MSNFIRVVVVGVLAVHGACVPQGSKVRLPPPLAASADLVRPAASAVLDVDAAGAVGEVGMLSAVAVAPRQILLDNAAGVRRRVTTSVLLFGIAAGDTLRFVPMLCSINGKLSSGMVCGKQMPASALVRTTGHSVTGDAHAVGIQLQVARTRVDFIDEAGGRTYKAPHGPACCMYNTCVEETIPYTAKAISFADRDVPLLAIWPADAEIGLMSPVDVNPSSIVGAPPWNANLQYRKHAHVIRYTEVDGHSLLSVNSITSSEIWVQNGHGWQPVNMAPANAYTIMGFSDIDHDGRREAVVYEDWSNSYGVFALGNVWDKPFYRFSCGNI